MDWNRAEQHLKMIEAAYSELITKINVNPFFVLGYISAVRKRFERGERTEALYKEIMNLE